MKKVYSILFICLMFLMTSCMTSAQTTSLSYYDEYLVENAYYPVVYIESYPYYFYHSTWIRIPLHNYHLIRHLGNPCRYIGHDRVHFVNRTVHHTYHPRVINRTVVPSNHHRPDVRNNGYNHNHNFGNTHSNGRPTVRPNTRPNTRPNQGFNRGQHPGRSNNQGHNGGRR